jgi:hypothetical protein
MNPDDGPKVPVLGVTYHLTAWPQPPQQPPALGDRLTFRVSQISARDYRPAGDMIDANLVHDPDALHLDAREASLLLAAMDKLGWSYSHVGMSEANPKRVALATLRAKVAAARYPAPDQAEESQP